MDAAKFSDLPTNPFDDNIVYEPRAAEFAVAGLNDAPLHRLVEQFAALEAEPAPRRRAIHLKAQLVTSAEPGYGKSHLIGRLFQTLEHRATLVYLRPPQDARSAWRALLLKIIQQLDLGFPSPLDALAAAVWAGLLRRQIERGKLEGDTAGYWAARLRDEPLAALGFGGEPAAHGMADWLRRSVAEGLLLPALERDLGAAGVTLHSPAAPWLAVLRAYGVGERHGPERAAALQWLKGEWLSLPELATVGLFPAQAAVSDDPDAAGRNEEAWQRLQDLGALVGFHRPFLLCFDQTELLTGRAELAAEFGTLIEGLVSFGLNLAVLVTTNLSPWRDNILPHIQTALRARFSAPLEMEGINAGQARALAVRRLQASGVAHAEIERFFAASWFENYFRESPTESVRRFLDRCAARCRQLGVGSPAAPELSLDEYFTRLVRGIERAPQKLVFDPGVLQWAVSPEAVGAAIAERTDDPHGYTPIRWRRPADQPNRQILFGFEDSNDGRLWHKIMDQTIYGALQLKTQGLRTRLVFLRTPEQKTLPLPSWPVVGKRFREAAADGILRVVVTPPAQLAIIHAAHELYAHVMEGGTAFGLEETVRFIRRQLRGWWRELARDPARFPDASTDAPPPRT